MTFWSSVKKQLSFRLIFYYSVLAVLLALFGWMAMGTVGLIIAFWVTLLWGSVWQRPYRVEFIVISGIGLLSAAAMLPKSYWDNLPWMWAFLLIAISPLIDFVFPIFHGKH